jgi:magnesium chelatase family protein
VLEALREPLESKRIIIARAKQQIELPANFQLIAAMNPCPCGYLGHPKIKCTCTQDKIKRYLAKISGPLLDRIDLCIEVPNIAMENFITNNCNHKYTEQNKSICKDNTNKNYDSTIIKQRIIAANQIQLKRQGKANTELGNKTILKYCKLNSDCNNLITTAIKKFQLSARSYYTILKIARTIADLSNSKEITVQQLQEAIFLNKLSMLHRQSEYFN